MDTLDGEHAMQKADESELISVTTTVGRAEDAQRLAAELLSRRLAACVQVEGGLQSHYRWQGQACDEPEWRLTIKTVAARLPAIEDFMQAEHPYDLPQLLWQAQGASAAFAAWVREQVDAG
jgi:periplasmic divalent cation tolerance protein